MAENRYALVRYSDNVKTIVPIEDIQRFKEKKWKEKRDKRFIVKWPPSDMPSQEQAQHEECWPEAQILLLGGRFPFISYSRKQVKTNIHHAFYGQIPR